MAICLEQDADLHMAQLMPLPLTVSCFSKIQIGFTFLVPAHLGSPGKKAVKRVCVCHSSERRRGESSGQMAHRGRHLSRDHVASDGQPEAVDVVDAERESLDAPAVAARPHEAHAVRVGVARVRRHLPATPAAAQRLRRVDQQPQTGSDVGGGARRLDGDVEVAGVRATVADVHRAVAVLLYTITAHVPRARRHSGIARSVRPSVCPTAQLPGLWARWLHGRRASGRYRIQCSFLYIITAHVPSSLLYDTIRYEMLF